MGVQGFQDFWVTGSHFYFQKDPVGGVVQPLRDLGVISDAISPGFENDEIELFDSDGGIRSRVDKKISSIDETYDIVLRSFHGNNLALLFIANDPESFSQTAEELVVEHYLTAGELVKLSASDGTYLYAIAAVAGIVSDIADLSTATLTTIVAATRSLTVTQSIGGDLDPGDFVIVRRTALTNIANSRTYTHESDTGAGPTVIVVEETPAANETAISGALVYKATADTGVIYGEPSDWEIYDLLVRGVVQVTPGGTIVDGIHQIIFSKAALTGKRLIKPQTARTVRGKGIMIWGRENNEDQTVREADMILSTTATNFSVEDFSDFTLQAQVVSDFTEATLPAGRLLNIQQATLPTSS